MFAFVVSDLVFSIKPGDCLGRTSPKWPLLCRVGLWTSVCLSVSLSITSRCYTKMAKRKITSTTPYDSPWTLVLWRTATHKNLKSSTLVACFICNWIYIL